MRFYVPFVAATALLASSASVQTFAQTPAQTPAQIPPSEIPSTGWIADAKTGCKIWDAAPEPDEKITWSGACAGGMAEGRGTLEFLVDGESGTHYEGDMRAGQADGHGLNVLPDGTRYEGEWRNSAAHGYGVLTERNGERHEGPWTNGCLKQGAREFAVGVTRESCGLK